MLVPLMAVGTFGGAHCIVHCHDDSGTHLHSVSSIDGGECVQVAHAAAHQQGDAPSPTDTVALAATDCADQNGNPDGTEVSLGVHKQISPRGPGLAEVLLFTALVSIALPPETPPPPVPHAGSPGVPHGKGPVSFIALCANERLVSTSRALLL